MTSRHLLALLPRRNNILTVIRYLRLERIVLLLIHLLHLPLLVLLVRIVLLEPVHHVTAQLVLLRHPLIDLLRRLVYQRTVTKILRVLTVLLHLLRVQPIALREMILIQLLSNHLRLMSADNLFRRQIFQVLFLLPRLLLLSQLVLLQSLLLNHRLTLPHYLLSPLVDRPSRVAFVQEERVRVLQRKVTLSLHLLVEHFGATLQKSILLLHRRVNRPGSFIYGRDILFNRLGRRLSLDLTSRHRSGLAWRFGFGRSWGGNQLLYLGHSLIAKFFHQFNKIISFLYNNYCSPTSSIVCLLPFIITIQQPNQQSFQWKFNLCHQIQSIHPQILMNGQTLEEKQTLLRKQIYESGLDTEAFGQYMGTVKAEGQNIDLNNWTVTELRDLIIRFKQIRAKSIQSVINSKISHIAKKSTIFDFVPKQKVKYEGTELWDYEINDEQECGKSTVLLKFNQKTKPIIKVEKSQIKTVGGFIFGIGSRNELEVTLKTNFTPYTVVRKGQDCDWLRRMLIYNYPSHFVPPLENERELNREDERGISYRQTEIQRFLNSMVCYSAFHTSPAVKEFFDQPNYKKFVQFRTTEQSAIVQKNLDSVHTPSGSFTVNISSQINNTIKIAANISGEMNSLYIDLNSCCSKILMQLQNVSNNMKNLQDLGKKIEEKYIQLQKCLKIQEMNSPTILLSLNDVVLRLTNNLRKHMKIFSQFNNQFVRNAAKDWAELIANNRRRYNEQKNYLSFKDTLLRRKEKWLSDPTRWEIPEQQLVSINRKGVGKLTKQQCFDRMFPVDTETEGRMLLYLAYVNQNYLNSYKLFLLEQQKDLWDKFNVYSEQYVFFSMEVNNSLIGCKEMFAQ